MLEKRGRDTPVERQMSRIIIAENVSNTRLTNDQPCVRLRKDDGLVIIVIVDTELRVHPIMWRRPALSPKLDHWQR